MKNRCARVARPTSTISSPVANGSSVPAWPTRRMPGSSRRTIATTSCEVFPAGLSTRITPSMRTASLELRGDLAAQEVDQLVPGHRRAEAGGLAVAAAPLGPGDRGDVDALVGGAQRHLPPPVLAGAGEIAHETGHGRPGDGAQVVHDALGVVLLRAGLGVVLHREVGDRQPAVVVALDLGERAGQQLELAERDALVQAPVHLVDVHAG